MSATFQSTQKMKFKTETEYNMKSIRFLLLTITTMFIVIAGLMIVLGISVYSHYHGFSSFYESGKPSRVFTPSILSVFLGAVLLVVTSFGFFGSLKQSTCLVNLYALNLILILIVKLVVVILAFTLDAGTISKFIYIPVSAYGSDAEIQDEVDRLQVGLNCCGHDSYRDYIGMDLSGTNTTTVVVNELDSGLLVFLVPESCCAMVTGDTCDRLRHGGCRAAIANLIVQNSSVLGVLGVSVMFIQLLGIIFALLLARCIRRMKSEKALQSWTIKEQQILAREAQKNEGLPYIVQPESSVA